MAVDITERKSAEAFFRESDERLRLMMESVADYAIMMLDAEGRIEMWNSGAERVFGYTAEEATGQHGAIIFTLEDRRHEMPLKEIFARVPVQFSVDEAEEAELASCASYSRRTTRQCARA